jgi:hypothetical protein
VGDELIAFVSTVRFGVGRTHRKCHRRYKLKAAPIPTESAARDVHLVAGFTLRFQQGSDDVRPMVSCCRRIRPVDPKAGTAGVVR